MLKKIKNIGIFKANDIRGRYPEEINEEAAEFIAARIKKIFSVKDALPAGRQGSASGVKNGKIVVAHDARSSSPALYKAVIRGLGRGRILMVGMATTPMFYFLVNHFKAAGGIMVTASHNPKNYNGLKIVGKVAAPISGTDTLKIINESS